MTTFDYEVKSLELSQHIIKVRIYVLESNWDLLIRLRTVFAECKC